MYYKVLIVEDDPMVSMINEQYVNRNKAFRVVGTCKDGKSALAYLENNDVTLEDFLDNKIFADAPGTKLDPEEADVAGFKAYLDRFIAGLPIEKAAIETL